jgi:predicted nucleic acid-binding protein
VSEDSGAVPAPLVLDTSVIVAAARGDTGIMTLLQAFGARGQPLVVPALVITAALLGTRSEDAEAIMRGLELMDNVMIAPVRGADQAAALAATIARTGLDPWDAHAAAIADAAVCPILTLDAAKWRQHAGDLDEPLHIVEISDPDDEAP